MTEKLEEFVMGPYREMAKPLNLFSDETKKQILEKIANAKFYREHPEKYLSEEDLVNWMVSLDYRLMIDNKGFQIYKKDSIFIAVTKDVVFNLNELIMSGPYNENNEEIEESINVIRDIWRHYDCCTSGLSRFFFRKKVIFPSNIRSYSFGIDVIENIKSELQSKNYQQEKNGKD